MVEFEKIVDVLSKNDSLYNDVFSNNKFVHHELNKSGLHIFRMLKARLKYEKRIDQKLHPIFHAQGFMVVRGLVDESNIKNGKVYSDELNTIVNELGFFGGEIYPVRKQTFHQPHDPQYHAHIDTFHPTLKIWVFNQDVKDEHGPFHIVPRTHGLHRQKLDWLHKFTNELIDNNIARTNPFYDDGSFRVDSDMYNEDYLVRVTGNKYDVVFADTSAIHFRGRATPGTLRDAYFITVPRVNIFYDNREDNLSYEEEERLLSKIYE